MGKNEKWGRREIGGRCGGRREGERWERGKRWKNGVRERKKRKETVTWEGGGERRGKKMRRRKVGKTEKVEK